MEDPVPIEVLNFASVVHELCGEACLTGSAPLTKHFYNIQKGSSAAKLTPAEKKILPRIKSTDIDVFAPFSPSRLAKQRSLACFDNLSVRQRAVYLSSSAGDPDVRMGHFTLCECEYLLWKRYGLEVCNVEQKVFTEVGIWLNNHGIWNQAANAGIRNIYNFKLKYTKDQDREGKILPCEVQLILVDAFPKQGQTWHEFTTDKFDIDIVKGSITIDEPSTLGKVLFEEASQGFC